MRTGIVVALLIAACAPTKQAAPAKPPGPKSQQPPPPPPVASKDPTCESAVDNSMSLSLAAAADADRPALTTQLDTARPKLVASCHEDHWSPKLLACLESARTDSATGACTDFLTPAQQEGVQKRLQGQ